MLLLQIYSMVQRRVRMTIEIRPLDEDTIIAEACCIGGRRNLDKESTLTEQEQTALRAAEMKADWLRKMVPRGFSARIACDGQVPILER